MLMMHLLACLSLDPLAHNGVPCSTVRPSGLNSANVALVLG